MIWLLLSGSGTLPTLISRFGAGLSLAGIFYSVSIPGSLRRWTSEGCRYSTRILDGIYVHRWRDASSLDQPPAMPVAIQATEYHCVDPGSNDSESSQSMFSLIRATESLVCKEGESCDTDDKLIVVLKLEAWLLRLLGIVRVPFHWHSRHIFRDYMHCVSVLGN